MPPPRLCNQGLDRAIFHIQQTIDAKIRLNSPNNISTLRKYPPVKPKRFSDESLDPITPYSIANLAGHADA